MDEKNSPWGATLDDFLDENGISEAAKAEAVSRVIAWLLTQDIEKRSRGGGSP